VTQIVRANSVVHKLIVRRVRSENNYGRSGVVDTPTDTGQTTPASDGTVATHACGVRISAGQITTTITATTTAAARTLIIHHRVSLGRRREVNHS